MKLMRKAARAGFAVDRACFEGTPIRRAEVRRVKRIALRKRRSGVASRASLSGAHVCQDVPDHDPLARLVVLGRLAEARKSLARANPERPMNCYPRDL